uniref:Uncharacterized protein n=1 Tax=Cacopsylla melanoneura TaxID=428564 RepID=A0A8D8PU07_9HEMI
MNFKPLWKRLKLLWNRKKTRYSAHNWNCPKSVKKSTAASKRKKRNSRTPARTTKERWTKLKPILLTMLKLNLSNAIHAPTRSTSRQNYTFIRLLSTKNATSLTRMSTTAASAHPSSSANPTTITI